MSSVSAGPVALRRAGDADREFLLQVYESTRVDEVATLPWSDEQKAAFLRMQAVAQDTDYRRHFGDETYLVVERAGEPIGRMYVHERDGTVRLVDIALLPHWRGRGIGTTLLRDLLADADRRGLRAELHVERWNPARRLYERLGFTVAGEDDVYALLVRVGPHLSHAPTPPGRPRSSR